MKQITYFGTLLLLFSMTFCTPKEQTIVEVEGGTIQGTREDSLLVFKGIPLQRLPSVIFAGRLRSPFKIGRE